MTAADSNQVLAWLRTEGIRYRETTEFVDAFAAELLRAGVELWRLTTGIHILHPQIDASSCLWQHGEAVTERRFRMVGDGLQQFRNSPMPIVYGGEGVRYRLESEPESGEFPILADLRAQGATDYIALPLPFSDGTWKAVTWATRRAGGFTDQDASLFQSLVPALAPILEIQTLHRTTLTLLDTYVGPMAGRRVLDGAIRRGMSETIHAVIWYCDLRDFTGLSETLPGDEIVAMLNDYFGAVTEAVARQGGEVLKFVGDAVLAIFPLSGETGSAVAERALVAARHAAATIGAANEERLREGRPPIRFGLALHVGDVLYGNVGGTERLDFTVIGRAVNVATRIESLCKPLGHPVLLSGDFAHLCERKPTPLGAFALKGVGTEQTLFAPPADPPASSEVGAPT